MNKHCATYNQQQGKKYEFLQQTPTKESQWCRPTYTFWVNGKMPSTEAKLQFGPMCTPNIITGYKILLGAVANQQSSEFHLT